jgi:hypothetical protein
MSSGTQIDVDWAGIDGAPEVATAPPTSGAHGARSESTTSLTDEEILGIVPTGTETTNRDVISSEARNPSPSSNRNGAPSSQDGNGVRTQAEHSGTAGEMPAWMQAAAGDPTHGAEAQRLWQEHQAFRTSFSTPEEARAIKELFPGGAQEAQSLRQAAQAVDQLDAAIYSGDARAQSEVVAELARANPAAFRQLFSEAAKVLAGMGQPSLQLQPQVQSHPGSNQTPTLHPDSGQALRENREGWGTQQGPYAQHSPYTQSTDQNSRVANHDSLITSHESPATNHPSPSLSASQSPPFDPVAYAAFERSTNDTVARDVRAAVGDTLTRVLPDGIADGAARRIGEDIFNEIHRTLAADRSLSEQIGEILRGSSRDLTANGWHFGRAEQQRVASLLASHAKQLVPGVARRVIGEWTSSVLGASRSKAARQASAAARVDIPAPGGSLDSMPLRPMSNREIDYASMSDDEILGM